MSLSAEYVEHSRAASLPATASGSFWERYRQAIDHVRQIDQHDAFADPAIANLFDFIDPAYVTYEFTFGSRDEWLEKIRLQSCAMARVHTDCKEVPGVPPETTP